jgi:hypothetical protein
LSSSTWSKPGGFVYLSPVVVLLDCFVPSKVLGVSTFPPRETICKLIVSKPYWIRDLSKVVNSIVSGLEKLNPAVSKYLIA